MIQVDFEKMWREEKSRAESAEAKLAEEKGIVQAQFQRIKDFEAKLADQSNVIIELGAKLNATKLREEGLEERLAAKDQEVKELREDRDDAERACEKMNGAIDLAVKYEGINAAQSRRIAELEAAVGRARESIEIWITYGKLGEAMIAGLKGVISLLPPSRPAPAAEEKPCPECDYEKQNI